MPADTPTPDVTVVVIGYNDVDNLADAVVSVLNQTLYHLEVVIVDDASTDGTGELADRLAGRDPRVRVVHLPENSGGCSRPRNVGIDHAGAPYVMFLDSDDELERHACKNLLLEAERTGADVVAGKCVRVFQDRDRDEKQWAVELYRQRWTTTGLPESPELFYDPLSTNKLYRRGFLEETGIRFPEGVHYEDSLFSVMVYVRARLIALIPNAVYYWNVARDAAGQSITQRRVELEHFRDRLAVHRMIDDYLREHGLDDLVGAKNVKFVRHDLRLHSSDLAAQNLAYQQEFVQLAAEYLETIPDESLSGLSPVEHIAVLAVRRLDVPLLLSTVDYLRFGYAVSTSLVERDGRVYWTEHHLDDPDARAVLDVTDLGLHRLRFGEQVLHNRVTRADIRSGWMTLAGELRNQLGRIAAGDRLSLRLSLRNRSHPRARTVPAEVVEVTPDVVRWRASFALADALGPVDQPVRTWSVRLGVDWAGQRNAVPLYVHRSVVDETPVEVRARLGGLVTAVVAPVVTRQNKLAFQQRDDPARSGEVLASVNRLAQRAETLIRRRPRAAVGDPRLVGLAYRLLQRLRVRPGLTVFESHLGRQYSDNPRYVFEAAREIGFDGLGLRPVWSFADERTPVADGVRSVRRGGWRHAFALARAEYWVDNQGLPRRYGKRDGTTYLQTWHGTPLKTMGFDEPSHRVLSPRGRRAREQSVGRWDALVAPSEYFVDTFARSYRFDGKILRTGYPRNDPLVRYADDADHVARLRERLGLPSDRTIVLYAPTFRDETRDRAVDLTLDLEAFGERLGDSCYLLVRTHYLERFELSGQFAPFARDVSTHDDMTELLLAADVLVTDYSSSMFDFANTGRPMVFFAYDYGSYLVRRGTYFDLAATAPGAFASTTEQVLAALVEVVESPVGYESEHAERYAAWRARYCEYETGHAARDVVRAVFGSSEAT